MYPPSIYIYFQNRSKRLYYASSKNVYISVQDPAYKGYGVARLFRRLVLQFMEDIYDRELERYIQGDNAAK